MIALNKRELASKLGIGLLVSNHQNAMRLVRSMHNLMPHLEGAKISMLFNGKDYENRDNLQEIIDNIPEGLELVHNDPIPYKEIKENYFSDAGELSSLQLMRLRQMSVEPLSDRAYWFVMDDDMAFGHATDNTKANAGLMILRAVAYMEMNPKCGVINGGSTMIKKLKPWEVGIYNKPCWMARGLLLRNVDNLLVDEGLMEVSGGGEDVAIWYDRIHKGYYCGVVPHFRVTHYHDKVSYGNKSEVGKADWHKESIRRHPKFGAETKMKEVYDIDYNFVTMSHQDWTSYIENKLREKFGADTFDPRYTADMSFID